MALNLHYILIFLLSLALSESYIITTPRRWTIGAGSQICVSLEGATFTSKDSLKYRLKSHPSEKSKGSKSSFYPRFTDLNFPIGSSFGCLNVPVPPSDERNVILWINGNVGKEPVNETVSLVFVDPAERTFISTDKYLYRPGQLVQFRILSVCGPKIRVSTDSYEEVIVFNPSNTRIAQWNNVSNEAGLVHLSFQLFDEIEEGIYRIQVRIKDKSPEEKIFEVRDFVLPRYEIVLEHPTGVLGSDENVTINVCARYTFGEPVRGTATVHLALGGYENHINLTQVNSIDGCQSFNFSGRELFLDYNNCYISAFYLSATAVIVEDGTNVTMYAVDGYIPIHRTGIKFKDITKSSVPKPYLPVIMEVAASYVNNTPAINEPMKICFYQQDEYKCKNFTSDGQGIIRFIVPSHFPFGSIKITAVNYPRIERLMNVVMEESYTHIYSYDERNYVDSTNASLTIMKKMVECTTGEDISARIPVVYVTSKIIDTEINVQITSRGQILVSNRMKVRLSGNDLGIKEEDILIPLEKPPTDYIIGSFDLPLTIPEQSSPQLTVLVWYVKEDGSVVADATDVEVSACLPHRVSFDWSAQRVEPGEDATLMIKGASNALCSIGVVDKSVDILSAGNNNYLNIASLLGVVFESNVDKFENTQYNLDYCIRKYGSSLASVYPNEQSEFGNLNPERTIQALHMFNDAGYAVISNLDLARKFCMELIMQAKNGGGIIRPPIGAPEVTERTTELPGLPTGQPPPPADTPPSGVGSTQTRSYLPETWLWYLQSLSASGELNEVMTLPDTITEWVGNAVCVHPTEGVGISNSSSIITFKPFFVDLTLPSSAKRGEILPITISIFNYLANDLPVRVFVEGGTDFQFVEGETGVRELCIKSMVKAVEIIKVNLTRIGDINITVEASSQPLSSGYCGSGSPALKTDRLIVSLPVVAEGYLRERTFNEYICSQDIEGMSGPVSSWVLEVPEGAVIDSERAWITAIGDLIGPALENLEDLVRLPYGCGEQNMVNFAPNIYILQYLDASGQTTPSIRERIVGFLNEGYQRQLMYRHSTGSYSAFGEGSGDGSTWLTAFVVKSFAQAIPYILIDNDSLQGSINWLANLQEPDGCFVARGFVFNSQLQGGLGEQGGPHTLLSAYVLAAILEMGSISSNRTLAAVRCVEMDTSIHPYNLALRSYSLALAKAASTKNLIDQLLGLSVSNSTYLRWILPDSSGPDTSLEVETAAYALLTIITHDYNTYKEEAKKIVRWITSQRNGQGGYVSTQDTVVALQALAAFQKTKSKEEMNMDITVTSSDLDHSFKITDENRLLLQRVDVPSLPTTIEINADGVGCALVQGVLRYNVLTDSISDAFALRVRVGHVSDEGCDGKTRNITICTSYGLPDGASNMAIIALNLVTGYVASRDDLQSIVGSRTGVFKRFEIEDHGVTLYLERITAAKICINIRAFPEIEVEDAKPGSVSVYDYYQPEYIATQVLNLTLAKCPS